MHGEGHRRVCPECGQSVAHKDDILSHRELRGPRNITSSNVDRVFDDSGRLLFIEEKNDTEPPMKNGQRRLLTSLARAGDVWVVKGNPDALKVWKIYQDGGPELLAATDMSGYQELVYQWFNP